MAVAKCACASSKRPAWACRVPKKEVFDVDDDNRQGGGNFLAAQSEQPRGKRSEPASAPPGAIFPLTTE